MLNNKNKKIYNIKKGVFYDKFLKQDEQVSYHGILTEKVLRRSFTKLCFASQNLGW